MRVGSAEVGSSPEILVDLRRYNKGGRGGSLCQLCSVIEILYIYLLQKKGQNGLLCGRKAGCVCFFFFSAYIFYIFYWYIFFFDLESLGLNSLDLASARISIASPKKGKLGS